MLRLTTLIIALLIPLGASSRPCAANAPQCIKPSITTPASPLLLQVMAELRSLDLTSAQTVALMRIASDARDRHELIAEEQERFREQAGIALEAGTADLVALAAQREAFTDRRVAAARVTRDELLVFYAGLSPSQQLKVQHWMASAIERLEALRSLAGVLDPQNPL